MDTGDASTVTIGPTGTQIKDMSFLGTTIYAVRGGSSGGVQLGTIDATTGLFTDRPSAFGTGDGSLGAINLNRIEGLAGDPTDGTLYAVHQRHNEDDLLFKVAPSTGAVVEDGFGTGVDYVEIGSATRGNDDIDALAVQPGTGQMYGLAKAPGSSDTIVRINKADGSVTTVGNLGLNNAEGLTFDVNGNLFTTTVSAGGAPAGNALYSVNVNTGAATQIGTMDLAKYEAIACGPGTSPPEPVADLSLNKTANRSAVAQGDHVSFTVTITNDGPDDATGVVVADGLPDGLSLLGATPSVGTYADGLWTVGSLHAGETETLVLTAVMDVVGTVENTAEVLSSDQADPAIGNNADSVTVSATAPPCGIEIIKFNVDGPVEKGERIATLIGLQNTCDVAVTEEIYLTVNGEVVDSTTVTLGPGDRVGDRLYLVWGEAMCSADGEATFELVTEFDTVSETVPVHHCGDRSGTGEDPPDADPRRDHGR